MEQAGTKAQAGNGLDCAAWSLMEMQDGRNATCPRSTERAASILTHAKIIRRRGSAIATSACSTTERMLLNAPNNPIPLGPDDGKVWGPTIWPGRPTRRPGDPWKITAKSIIRLPALISRFTKVHNSCPLTSPPFPHTLVRHPYAKTKVRRYCSPDTNLEFSDLSQHTFRKSDVV